MEKHPVRKLSVAFLLLKLKTFYSTCAIEIQKLLELCLFIEVRKLLELCLFVGWRESVLLELNIFYNGGMTGIGCQYKSMIKLACQKNRTE